MNKFFIFLFIVFCVKTGYAQDKVAEYYKNVNQAELAICKSKYATASKHYERAFKTGVCFKRDLKNALTLDYKYTEKEVNVLEYTHKLAQRGVRTSVINKVDSVKHPALYGQVKQIQDTTPPIFDSLLLKQLDTLLTVDQSYRVNGFAYQKENRHITDSLDLINYEAWLALYDTEDEAIKQTMGIFFLGTPDLLLRHNIPFHRFPEDLLWGQVKEGYLDVRDYGIVQSIYLGSISDAEREQYRVPMSGGMVANKTIFLFYSKKDDPKARERMYCFETPKEYVAKCIYEFYNGTKEFFLAGIGRSGKPCCEESERIFRREYAEFEINQPEEYKKLKIFTLTDPDFDCENFLNVK